MTVLSLLLVLIHSILTEQSYDHSPSHRCPSLPEAVSTGFGLTPPFLCLHREQSSLISLHRCPSLPEAVSTGFGLTPPKPLPTFQSRVTESGDVEVMI